jgi:hypothetical protein
MKKSGLYSVRRGYDEDEFLVSFLVSFDVEAKIG